MCFYIFSNLYLYLILLLDNYLRCFIYYFYELFYLELLFLVLYIFFVDFIILFFYYLNEIYYINVYVYMYKNINMFFLSFYWLVNIYVDLI